MSSKYLKIPAKIVMPVTAPAIKVEAVRSHGAEVILQGKSFAEAFAVAKDLEEKEGSIFVSPYDDEHIVAGQGTVGMEILSSANGKPLDIIFVCCSNKKNRTCSK